MHSVKSEPRLDAHDRAVWDRLMIQARMRAKSVEHRRLVDAGRRIASECLAKSERPAVSWSGGKDSSCMSHLVLSLDPSVTLVSEKDDLDYPGEETYITELATRWQAKLEILRPDISPSQWIAEHADQLAMGDDFHSRAAGLSKACFYGVMEQDDAKRDLVFIGLRADESVARRKNRAINGLAYRRKAGHVVCTPLADWRGIDVFAYLQAQEIEPLHVYRCVGFMHEREPWRVRKSWWIPGDMGKYGGASWLRRYYPSLFQRLLKWFPRAQSYA